MSRQISGIVGPHGEVNAGCKGCKVQRLDRGFYIIEFDQPFAETPVVTATVCGHPWRTFNMSAAVTDDLNPMYALVLTSTPDSPEECGFSFIVVGE